jgi:ketosteroid isomerase-like protein
MNNLEIIKTLYQAFARGDLDRVFELLDPQVEWIESDSIPYGGKFIGIEAVKVGVFQKIVAEWSNFQVSVEEFIDAGDKIITLGYDSGTYKATGKSMRAPTASIWTLQNGRVISFVQYIDTLKVVAAVSDS